MRKSANDYLTHTRKTVDLNVFKAYAILIFV